MSGVELPEADRALIARALGFSVRAFALASVYGDELSRLIQAAREEGQAQALRPSAALSGEA